MVRTYPRSPAAGYPGALRPAVRDPWSSAVISASGRGRANMVLTAARRALPASVLPGLSRSRAPAMSRAAATRSALAVLRHTQSSSYHRPLR